MNNKNITSVLNLIFLAKHEGNVIYKHELVLMNSLFYKSSLIIAYQLCYSMHQKLSIIS